jgi:hypothetical protein
VTVDVCGDHTADDSSRDQRKQRSCHQEPALVPSFVCFRPAESGAGVGIDRLKDVPRGQGVEN